MFDYKFFYIVLELRLKVVMCMITIYSFNLTQVVLIKHSIVVDAYC